MFGIGTGELILILVVVLLFFGPKRLPELARALGRANKEYSKAKEGISEAMEAEAEPPPPQTADDQPNGKV